MHAVTAEGFKSGPAGWRAGETIGRGRGVGESEPHGLI